jgi:hypothetical protein
MNNSLKSKEVPKQAPPPTKKKFEDEEEETNEFSITSHLSLKEAEEKAVKDMKLL